MSVFSGEGHYRKLPRYLSEEDYRRLEDVILNSSKDDPYDICFDRAWFLTFAHTGVRRSELIELRLGDLNLVSGAAIVRDGKFGHDRIVYLTPPLISALEQYLALRPDIPDNDHLFILHGRTPSSEAIYQRLKKYGERLGLQISPHRLRHTFATRLLNRGMPITSLQKLLGHKNLDMTQRYAQVYDETLYAQFQAAISLLEGIPVEDWPHSKIVERKAPAGLDNSV